MLDRAKSPDRADKPNGTKRPNEARRTGLQADDPYSTHRWQIRQNYRALGSNCPSGPCIKPQLTPCSANCPDQNIVFFSGQLLASALYDHGVPSVHSVSLSCFERNRSRMDPRKREPAIQGDIVHLEFACKLYAR